MAGLTEGGGVTDFVERSPLSMGDGALTFLLDDPNRTDAWDP
jgi:hypothetical protein